MEMWRRRRGNVGWAKRDMGSTHIGPGERNTQRNAKGNVERSAEENEEGKIGRVRR